MTELNRVFTNAITDAAKDGHDDAALTEGHTMAKYAAWHARNCRCTPAAAAKNDDGAHADDEASAEARREEGGGSHQ